MTEARKLSRGICCSYSRRLDRARHFRFSATCTRRRWNVSSMGSSSAPIWQPRAVSVVGGREAGLRHGAAMAPEVDAFLAEVRATLDHPSLLM
jgi:hypothetical protein